MKRTIREIKKTCKSYNGGYITYYKLIKKFFELYKKNKNAFKLHVRIWIHLSIIFQFIFKPLMWFFSSITHYNVKYEDLDGKIKILQYSKEKSYYFLKIIPVFHFWSSKTTEKDLKECDIPV